jgi:hypothetical protein
MGRDFARRQGSTTISTQLRRDDVDRLEGQEMSDEPSKHYKVVIRHPATKKVNRYGAAVMH